MTQENKELLIKDLCSRLPYGVILRVTCEDFTGNPMIFDEQLGLVDLEFSINSGIVVDSINSDYSLDKIKPYLFPMSSMTEEQKEELYKEHGWIIDSYGELVTQDYTPNSEMVNYYDWLNFHHFDYRGLIDKGLSIDATNLEIYDTRR